MHVVEDQLDLSKARQREEESVLSRQNALQAGCSLVPTTFWSLMWYPFASVWGWAAKKNRSGAAFLFVCTLFVA